MYNYISMIIMYNYISMICIIILVLNSFLDQTLHTAARVELPGNVLEHIHHQNGRATTASDGGERIIRILTHVINNDSETEPVLGRRRMV